MQCCLDGCDQVEVGKSFIIQLDWEAEVAFLREEEVNCGGDEGAQKEKTKRLQWNPLSWQAKLNGE